MTLRSYLAEKLNCDPMRITKKFAGASCLGKRISGYSTSTTTNATHPPLHHQQQQRMTSVDADTAKAELEQLEHRFRMRIEHGQNGCLGVAAQAHAVAAAAQVVEQAAAAYAAHQQDAAGLYASVSRGRVGQQGGGENMFMRNHVAAGAAAQPTHIPSSNLNPGMLPLHLQQIIAAQQQQLSLNAMGSAMNHQPPPPPLPSNSSDRNTEAQATEHNSSNTNNGLTTNVGPGPGLDITAALQRVLQFQSSTMNHPHPPPHHPQHLPMNLQTPTAAAATLPCLPLSIPTPPTSSPTTNISHLHQMLQNAYTQAQRTVHTLPRPILQQLAVSQLVQHSLRNAILHMSNEQQSQEVEATSSNEPTTASSNTAGVVDNLDFISQMQAPLGLEQLSALLNSLQRQQQQLDRNLKAQPNNTIANISNLAAASILQAHQQPVPSSWHNNYGLTSRNGPSLSSHPMQMNGKPVITNNVSASTAPEPQPSSGRTSDGAATAGNDILATTNGSVSSSNPDVMPSVARSMSENSSNQSQRSMSRNSQQQLSHAPKPHTPVARSKEEKDTATMLLSILSTLRSNHNEAMQSLAASDLQRGSAQGQQQQETGVSAGDTASNSSRMTVPVRNVCDTHNNDKKRKERNNSPPSDNSSANSIEAGKTDSAGGTSGTNSNTSTTLSSSANGSDSGSASDERRLGVDGGSETMKTDQSHSTGSSGGSGCSEDDSDDAISKPKSDKCALPLKKRQKTAKQRGKHSSDSGTSRRKDTTHIGEFTSRNVADHNSRMNAIQNASPLEQNLSRAKISSSQSSNRGERDK